MEREAMTLESQLLFARNQIAALRCKDVIRAIDPSCFAADRMAKTLCDIADGTWEVTPELAETMINLAVSRAIEITLMDMTDQDEDHVWVQTDLYMKRLSIFTETLRRLARCQTPIGIAEDSYDVLMNGTGWNDRMYRACQIPAVQIAWQRVRDAIWDFLKPKPVDHYATGILVAQGA